MPDAATSHDMQPGDAGLLLHLRLWLLRTPLALPLLGVLGALVGGQGGWCIVAAAAALAGVLRLWRIGLCMMLCVLIAALHDGLLSRRAEHAIQAWSQHDAVSCEGTVIDKPGRGCVLRVNPPGISVALQGEDLPYAEGDRVRVTFAPREVESPPIKGMFDRAAWMRSRGITLEADYICGERLDTPCSWAALRGCATCIRHALAERLMPPGTESDPRRQIICALVLGASELAEPETMLPFRRGGSLHAFAVSGMHVVMLAGILWALLRVLRVHPASGRWVQLIVLGAYVIITGFSVPAVRACVMLATLLVGLSLRRRVGLANSWCFAALLVLLVEPWQLWSAGFLLSFTIYAAICAGARICLKEPAWFGPDAFIPPRIYTTWEQRQRQTDYALRGTIIVSLIAYIISLPLTWLLFHTITPWSFVTNIIIAPIIPLVMLGGLAMLVAVNIPMLGAAASWCALHAAGLLLAVSTWLGYLPGAYLPAEEPKQPQSAMVLGTGFGGSICMLGNPGLLIDCGNELTAALQVEPALFHSGYQPSGLLLSQPTKSHGGGAEQIRRSWPNVQLIRAAELRAQPLQMEGRAGRFTLYPPPAELPRRPAANVTPIVRWEKPDGSSLLYVGNASRATWEQLPPEARRADTLILGHNPRQPVDDPTTLRESGATLILLLPSASASQLQETHATPPARLQRMSEREHVSLP